MIRVNGTVLDTLPAQEGFSPNGLQEQIFSTMQRSSEVYSYNNTRQLIFELRLRNAIVQASRDLYSSGFAFRVFRRSFANPAYWERTREGGFRLLPGVKPSDAIRDIFVNGKLYGTECATGMVIVFYKALLDVLPEGLFNQMFSDIYLMDWQRLDRDLYIYDDQSPADLLPGDARYFKNPAVDPKTPEWQGENTFYLGGGKYYGHGIGITDEDRIIKVLNATRRPGATTEAFLMNFARRQNYKALSNRADQYLGVREVA